MNDPLMEFSYYAIGKYNCHHHRSKKSLCGFFHCIYSTTGSIVLCFLFFSRSRKQQQPPTKRGQRINNKNKREKTRACGTVWNGHTVDFYSLLHPYPSLSLLFIFFIFSLLVLVDWCPFQPVLCVSFGWSGLLFRVCGACSLSRWSSRDLPFFLWHFIAIGFFPSKSFLNDDHPPHPHNHPHTHPHEKNQ